MAVRCEDFIERPSPLNDVLIEEGQTVSAGDAIGSTAYAGLDKGLLDLKFLASSDSMPCAVDGSNAVCVDPLVYLAKPECDMGFLEPPMANIHSIPRPSPLVSPYGSGLLRVPGDPEETSGSASYRYLNNLDLDDGKAYLRKLVQEYAINSLGHTAGDIDKVLDKYKMLHYYPEGNYAVVRLNHRVKIYGATHGDQVVNDRIAVDRAAFEEFFFADWAEADVLGSPGYMNTLSNFMDTDLAGMSPLYGLDAMLKLANSHAINKMMADVNAYGSTDSISDAYWRVFCLKFNSCVQGYGGVWQEVHYFRNKLNSARVPNTLDELIAYNNLPSSSDTKWQMMGIFGSRYHMYGTNGEYNLKFISYDGIYECVYNIDGILLTENNDPLNMGSYNYCPILFWLNLPEDMTHQLLDVSPWEIWGNAVNDPRPSGEDTQNKYYSNPDAVAYRASKRAALGLLPE